MWLYLYIFFCTFNPKKKPTLLTETNMLNKDNTPEGYKITEK